eukprot:TRINITY_DN2324_c0_g1_i2.p1 TRINITY_DN2324_c0_g1~~TRINITY_DN2324_c0_g1_i2.p1  ORF type:complete len:210 (-),score=24.63 TRINITY_DN2324_c0_g1_i2:41-670(-)
MGKWRSPRNDANTNEDDSVDIVCLGIGSLSSLNSQYQFAIFLILRELLNVKGKCIVFDPILTNEDVQLINSFNASIADIHVGRHRAHNHTIYFMPHCPEGLYSNLLLENWNVDNLGKLFIIGNALSMYELIGNKSKFKSLILEALPYTNELPLPSCKKYNFANALNDQSVHVFDLEKLSRASNSFWSLKETTPEWTEGEILNIPGQAES